jgi:hypothetical protein
VRVHDTRRLWRIKKATEFERTWARAESQLSRPDAHCEAIRLAVSRNPHKCSTAVKGEDVRVVVTKDPQAGKATWTTFRIHREERACELGWVQVRDLGPGDPDDELS